MKKFDIPIQHRRKESGFTRLEMLFAGAAVTLLFLMALPLLAATDAAAKLESCVQNLRQIGAAYSGWSKDHGQRMPWRVSVEEGGSFGSPSAGFAWVQFYYLTNHLKSPSVLACPADDVKQASNWGRTGENAYLDMLHRSDAVSYMVGLDVRPESPRAILSGDRHLTYSELRTTCDFAQVQTASSLEPRDDSVGWTEKGHERQGNILFNDGSVTTFSTSRLQDALAKTQAVHEQNHVLKPR